jgi:hypothetical protein
MKVGSYEVGPLFVLLKKPTPPVIMGVSWLQAYLDADSRIASIIP